MPGNVGGCNVQGRVFGVPTLFDLSVPFNKRLTAVTTLSKLFLGRCCRLARGDGGFSIEPEEQQKELVKREESHGFKRHQDACGLGARQEMGRSTGDKVVATGTLERQVHGRY